MTTRKNYAPDTQRDEGGKWNTSRFGASFEAPRKIDAESEYRDTAPDYVSDGSTPADLGRRDNQDNRDNRAKRPGRSVEYTRDSGDNWDKPAPCVQSPNQQGSTSTATDQLLAFSENTSHALRIWEDAEDIADTVAEKYLDIRGIGKRRRRHSNLRYAELRSEGGYHPALLAAILSPDGSFQGISRTFLKVDGSGKAELDAPRKSLGTVKGGAVQLALPVRELVLCEGLEDGLSIMEAVHQPVWAVLGSANFGSLTIPNDVERLIIARDNDRAGVQAANAAAQKYFLQGLKVSIAAPPHPFKDFNEALRSAGQPSEQSHGDRS